MSQIALSPNPAGNGTFTIEAPNSNTNRTLSLPDAAGVMYAQGNILGTVSQSGGVPTGAIIERGSNANGEYVKYADGTMVCWGTTTRTLDIAASQYLGGWRSGGDVFDFTFPATFNTVPVLVANPIFPAAFSILIRPQTTATTGSFLLTAVSSQGSEARTVVWNAVGRWF